MNDTPALYDRNGIPIMPGDTLKVFHYTAAVRREKRFMYKWVIGIDRSGRQPLMKISHLSLELSHYWELMDGRTLKQCEIVQGYEGVAEGGDYRNREKKAAK